MTNYYTPIIADEEVDPAALNTRFTELDTQIFALAGGTGYEVQTANRVFAGPSTGSPAAPTFRSLVAADMSAALTTPPAIGGTIPAAGTFTTLNANTSLTVNAANEATIFGTGSGNTYVALRGGAGSAKEVRLYTSTTRRWSLASTNDAESGSDTGSNFGIARYNDAGSFVSFPIQIIRSTGRVIIGHELDIDGSFNHDGNTFGALGATPVTRPTVSGSRGGNAALASLCTALANLGLITDSTS